MCGGPIDEVPRIIDVLRGADLVTQHEGRLRLTQPGVRVATQDHQYGGRLLATALIRAGYFADQARRLAAVANIDPVTGDISFSRTAAVKSFPQLLGILRRFPELVWSDPVRVPGSIAAELSDVWSLLPQRVVLEDRRKSVGDRGEMYSFQFERIQAEDSAKIRWVALDDDSLGHDIEDLTTEPRRRIEVKASASPELRFFLSNNEFDAARRHRSSYEVQFWGAVDLNRSAADDYAKLRQAGYPLVFRDVPALLALGDLVAECSQYLVTSGKLDPSVSQQN